MAEVSRLRVVDRLRNLVSGMGTDKDKSAQAYWLFCELSQSQVEAAYRGDWMARKVVDIPPNDATREWRAWYADDKDIAAIEEVEEKHGIQQKVCEALAKARLYGGAAMLLGIGDEDPSKEMDPEHVGLDGLKFVHVMSRWEVQADELDRDPMSEFYGTPKMYSVTSQTRGVVKIHPTRVIRFIGSPRPSIISSVDGWGDSVLQSVQDAIKDAGSSASSIASLVAESKVDIIKIPNLSEHLSSSEYSDGLTTRFTYANTLKSTINTLLLDKEEEWERINVNFAGLPDVLKTFLLILSGAADIPATRMLGQSPAGMSATGDSDTRNYYDKIASEQNTRLAPALRRLDDVIQASALGKIDPDIYYEWNPLWQMNEQEKADIDLKQAQTWKSDHDAGLIDPEILVEARANQIIEAGTYPGFKQIVDDHGGELLAPKEPNPFLMNVDPNDPTLHPDLAQQAVKHQAEMGAQGFAGLKQNAAAGAGKINAAQAKAKDAFNQALKDMQPRTLYVRRDLIDPTEITAWAKSQGITGLQSDLHVTICYSQKPVNWLAAGEADWGQNEDGSLTVAPGGPRVVEQWVDRKGRNILVLQFASCALAYRHADILQRTDASYDLPEYIPHITLTTDRNFTLPLDTGPVEGEVDLAMIEPYRGEIELGPEIFEEIRSEDDDEIEPLTEDEYRPVGSRSRRKAGLVAGPPQPSWPWAKRT
jgi:hypothetical protein